VAGRVLTAAVLVSVAFLGCGDKGAQNGHAAKAAPTTPAATSRAPATTEPSGAGKLVDIGGRSLYLECIGSGSPTVVLEAGFGGDSTDWAGVVDALGRTTRTCSYDRAGLGSSLAAPGIHDAGDEIADLAQLLDRAAVPPPYVLVGHSYGGLLARLFAKAHPDSTAGVVLVDALGRDATRRQLAIWPKSEAPTLREALGQAVVAGVDTRAGEALGRTVRTLGNAPLVVVTAGQHKQGNETVPPPLLRLEDRLWSTMQAELARLSSNHVHVVALRSDHFVHGAEGQPDVVIKAIQAVVEAQRTRAKLPPCTRLFTGAGVRCRG
jgi:pimeloyl-ACP methyl ester carboxylesterase